MALLLMFRLLAVVWILPRRPRRRLPPRRPPRPPRPLRPPHLPRPPRPLRPPRAVSASTNTPK